MKLVLALIASVLVTNISIASSEIEKAPVKTVARVDLQQYMGKWYEIASIPQFFQRKCVANTSAEYSFAEENLVRVYNSCETKTGERTFAEGRAKVIDTQSNSKLKVTFVKFFDWIFSFGGNYWILDLGENYSYAVIGDPSRSYSWILSRNPWLSTEQLTAAAKVLQEQGYDTCLLLTSVQSGGMTERKPLCEITPK